MAPYGFEVVKSVSWRGATEQFSNVYHYDVTANLGSVTALAILDALVAAEKPAFSADVTFVSGRVWGPTDQGQAASQTVAIKDYSGTGTSANNTMIPYETTLVVENYIGRGPAGRKQFLRKYLHVCRLPAGASGSAAFGNTILDGTSLALGTAYWNRVKSLTASSNNWPLCTKAGKHYDNVADSPTVLPYLHVRQFHQ
jgi:hypothetical protein